MSIIQQVGPKGKITPIALVHPVTIGKITVKRVSLYNYKHIENMGIQVGSNVRVALAGDVIPKIIEVL